MDENRDLYHASYGPPAGGIGDFCLVHDDDAWHLFHTYREYDKPYDEELLSSGLKGSPPGQSTKLGHAVSEDLVLWGPRDIALAVRPDKWDSAHLWAPAVVGREGLWYMFYTGVGEDYSQKIGVVTSKDLLHWEYPVDSPIIDVSQYSWARAGVGGCTDCRAPSLLEHAGQWLCYYTAVAIDGQMVVGLAASDDLLEWSDEGYVLSRPIRGGEEAGYDMIESPCVFRKDDLFYLVFNQGCYVVYTVSSDARDFSKEPVRKFEKWPCGFNNFEMVDVDTGLFAYAGPAGFFRNLRFGYVDFEKKEMSMRLCWRDKDKYELFFGKGQEQG